MEKDNRGISFYSNKKRYADLINGLGCDGQQVVSEDDLEEMDTRTGVGMTSVRGILRGAGRGEKTKNRRTGSKARDLIRKAKVGVNVVVFGVENQENIDYLLPLRNMVYEVGEYERQAQEIQRKVRESGENLTTGEYLYRFKKDSKLHPSITFILYYGKDDWDGARDLHGILDFTDIPESLRKLVQNFQIHLIEVRKLEDTSMFQTDVRQVFDLIRFSEDKDKLRELVQNDPSFQEMEEDAYDLAALYTKAEGLIGCKEDYRKGDKVDMCGAIEGLMEDARVEGRAAGRAAAERDYARLTERLIQDNRTPELLEAAKSDVVRERLYQEYGIRGTK